MGVFKHEQQLCPYCQECPEFQKLVELADSGLVVYCYKTRADDIRQGNVVESIVNGSQDEMMMVFILHNRKDVKITSSELTAELDKENISCPRCRQIFSHAQEVIKEVKSIDGKMVMGICDHCRKKARGSKRPFCACDRIATKFLSVQKEDTRTYVKKLPSEMGHLLNTMLNNQKQKEIRAYSNLRINDDQTSPAHEPEILQLFHQNMHKSEIHSKTEIGENDMKESHKKQGAAFVQSIEPMGTSTHQQHERENVKGNTTLPDTSLVNSNTSFLETFAGAEEIPRSSFKDRKQEQAFEDRTSMEDKESLKRRHDLSLRQMMRQERDSGVPYSVPKRSNIYETPKVTSKSNVQSEMDTKIIIPIKTKHGLLPQGTPNLDYTSDKRVKFKSSITVKNNPLKKADKYHHDKIKKELYDSEEGLKTDKKLDDRYITGEELTKAQRSPAKLSHTAKTPAQHEVNLKNVPTDSAVTGLKSRFKFVFPKVKEKKETQTKLNRKSSQLIKEAKEENEIKGQKRQVTKKGKQDLIETEEQDVYEENELQSGTMKEMENFRKAKEALKKKTKEKEAFIKEPTEEKSKEKEAYIKEPAEAKSKEKDLSSKKGKSTKKTRSSSDQIKNKRKDNDFESKNMRAKEKALLLAQVAEFKKLRAAHLKDKEEALKKKKQLEFETANAQLNVTQMKNVKLIKKRHGSEILNSVKIKQAERMRPLDIGSGAIKRHNNHLRSETKSHNCILCLNSDLELEVLCLDKKINKTSEKGVIIGEKIFKYKPRLEKTKKTTVVPLLFQKDVCVEPDTQPDKIVQIIPQETKPAQKQILNVSKQQNMKESEIEPDTKVYAFRYALSDRSFVDKGWTMLPTEKVMRKMNVYRMRPAHPEFDWFEHNKNKRLMTYDTGERLAEFDDNGRGRWYYRSGRLALDYYDAEETNAHQRFVIYSSGEPDERGRTHPVTILASFDYLGNGIVFDHAGKIRLKYNQTEGVLLDRVIGPVSHWKWHSLNDPPVLQQVMIDTQMAHKDPDILKLEEPDTTIRPDNEDMLAIEFDNFIKEKSKKLSQKFKPFQIKMKALKINEHFSLRVLDQATVYLIFRDGSTNVKLNIGMILDHQEIVDTDTAEVGEVSNSLERFPARTDSLASLQRSVAYAQRYERLHAERERRLRPPELSTSADRLTAATSTPLRIPLRTAPTVSSSSASYCRRKPTSNVYYNTRFL